MRSNEIQVSWQPDPLARPGDRVLRRYRLAADNLQGAAFTYADADGHTVRVNLIGLAALGGAPDADAEIRWSAEPVLRAEEAGQPVFGLDGTLRQPGGQAIIQLHAPAEDEAAFQTAVAPFTEVTGWMGFHPLIKTGGPRHKRREPPVHFYILSLFLSHCSQSSCQRWVR